MNELQTSLNELINNQRQMLNNQSTLLANVYDKSVIDDRMDKKLNIEDFNEIKDAMNLHLNQKNLARNGYTKLPNGLILQWGEASGKPCSIGAGGARYLFPIAFPNAVLQAVACDTGGGNFTVSIHPDSKEGYLIWNSVRTDTFHRFFAIGY